MKLYDAAYLPVISSGDVIWVAIPLVLLVVIVTLVLLLVFRRRKKRRDRDEK